MLKKKEIFTAQAKESGKPAEIIEKMIVGRIRKFLDEVALLGQDFVKDPAIKVEKLVKDKGAKVVNFIRLDVGEGIEKKEEDFAAEVMSQIKGQYMSNDSSECSQKSPKLKRILLKLSGDSLSADQGFGINVESAQPIIDQIKTLTHQGIKIAIVIGGGNILRGSRVNFGDKIKRATTDSMGTIATMINALALRDMLISEGVAVEAFSAKGVDGLLRVASAHEFNQLLDAGKVLIFAGGTGNPFVTTDTTASLRAVEIGADALLKPTTVDGVYDKDPNKYPDAKRFD